MPCLKAGDHTPVSAVAFWNMCGIKKFFKRDKHSSECALDKNKFHCVLDNSGTYEELEEKVEGFFRNFLLTQEM